MRSSSHQDRLFEVSRRNAKFANSKHASKTAIGDWLHSSVCMSLRHIQNSAGILLYPILYAGAVHSASCMGPTVPFPCPCRGHGWLNQKLHITVASPNHKDLFAPTAQTLRYCYLQYVHYLTQASLAAHLAISSSCCDRNRPHPRSLHASR